MTHEERLEIAREVSHRILEKYGERITAIAAYGSLAKGKDKAHSDLDLWVATNEPVEDVRFFVYKGIAISINWDTEQGRIRTAKRITFFWPIEADELNSYLVLYEREGSDFIGSLKEAASNLRDEDFAQALRVAMVRTLEIANKHLNAWETRDSYHLILEGRMLARGTALVLGLLNRRYYPGGRSFYGQSKQLPKLPKDYARLLDLASGFSTLDAEVVYKAGRELWANLCELVRAEGVEWEESELPL